MSNPVPIAQPGLTGLRVSGRSFTAWSLMRAFVGIACLLVGIDGSAQSTSKLRLIVGDCVNVTTATMPVRSDEVRQAVYAQLAAFLENENPDSYTAEAAKTYVIVDKEEVETARQRLSLSEDPAHSQSADERKANWRRLANAVKADVLVDWAYRITRAKRGRTSLAMTMEIRDVVTDEAIEGWSESVSAASPQSALSDVVNKVLRGCLHRHIVRTTIQQQNGNIVTLPVGTRDGVNVGDVFTVVRETGGIKRDVGRVKADKVTTSQTTAEIIEDLNAEVAPGTICTLVFVYGCFPVPAKK